jgi:glycerol-3-phosphate O-acyltransferase/dihydroxyacetone phosphate acyltransferase
MNILLHFILKILYLITARIYYSKITVLNLEKVPTDQPLLIAINHSNAFWDGVMIGLHTKQRVWFLARGDVFKKPLAAKILNAIGIAPIYRMQEGIENIEKNKEVFNRCYQILAKNQSIAIFPEGNCERESKLRPLKKGTARIAHGALESFNFSKNLFITCAGLNYDDPDNLNSEVLINFNTPILVNKYFEPLKPLDSKQALQLTKDIENSMDAVMYNVHDHENHQLFHFIKRNFLSLLISNKGSGQYEFDVIKKLSSKINTDQHSVDELKKMTLPYLELLNQHQLREKHITKYLVNRKFITDYIVFLFLLIPAIPALLLNSWPYFVAFKTAQKKVKKQEFFSSLNIGIAGILYFVWYILLFIIFTVFLPIIKAFMLLLVLHFSGIIALHLASYFRALKSHFKISGLSKKEKENLLKIRMHCMQSIQKFVQL